MIDVQFSDELGSAQAQGVLKRMLSRARVSRWVQHALRQVHADDQITVRIVGLEEGRKLNRDYRGKMKDYATNVLTFHYQIHPFLAVDIVLCAPVIALEAQQQGKALEAHWAHLITHGVLHAQGYVHESNARDALEMEALEILLLGALGYPNPY